MTRTWCVILLTRPKLLTIGNMQSCATKTAQTCGREKHSTVIYFTSSICGSTDLRSAVLIFLRHVAIDGIRAREERPQNFKYHLYNRTFTILPCVFEIYALFNKPDRTYSETYGISNPQLARIKHQRGESWRYTDPFSSFQAMGARAQPSSLRNHLSIRPPPCLYFNFDVTSQLH